jgi:hypothetical protein
VHHDKAPFHASYFTREFLTKIQHHLSPRTLLTLLTPYGFPCFPDVTVRTPIWHKWSYWDRSSGGTEHHHSTRLPGYI